MKRPYFLTLFLLLLTYSPLKADHIFGGEITWECLPSGQYVIHMKIYRDCTGIPLTGTQTITLYNYPNVGNSMSISMPEISSIDVSPDCNPWPGATQLSCGAGPPFMTMLDPATMAGSVVENTYESAAMTLNGTPPPQGWVFTWTSCCRNASNTNLASPLSTGHTLRAIMYPYTPVGATAPQSANPCYDNSPVFNESPSTVICTGYPFTYNHNASDAELDSLFYDWAQPLNSSFSGWNPPTSPPPVTFAAGYSFTNPLPSTPPNVGAVLDPTSGEIGFTAYTSGGYATCIKVEAWKCGQKVAEIFRDIQVIMLACSGTNNPPSVTITATPGSIPVTQVPGTSVWEATASPGDLVEFTMQALDIEFQPVTFLPQEVTFSASGGQLGNPWSSTTTGCINPPCATITPTGSQVGFTAPQQNNITFSWLTDCAHLAYETNCGVARNTYTFVLKMKDDFCPAPAISLATLSITVEADIADPPDLTCISYDPVTGDVEVNWIPPTDTGGAFESYIIYFQAPGSGNYVAIDTVYGWATTQTILSGLGGTGSFYIRTASQCNYTSEPSDTVGIVNLVVTPTPPTNSELGFLNWTSFGSSGVIYEVWAEAPAGSGSYYLLGTTTDTFYIDTVAFCNTQIDYQIRVTSNGVTCGSTVDGALFSDNTNSDVVVLDSVSVNAGNQSMISWLPSSSDDVVEYYLMLLDPATGTYNIVDTIDAAGLVLPYTYSGSDANAGPETYKLISVDSCGNQSSDLAVDPHSTIWLNNYLDKCESRNSLTWTRYRGFEVDMYRLFVTITPPGGSPTPKSLLYQGGPMDTTFVQAALQNNYTYCYEVEAIDTSGTITTSSNRRCVTAQVPNKSRVLYLGAVTNSSGGASVYTFIDGTADVINFDIERADHPLGPYSVVGSVAKPTAPPWTISYMDYSANLNARRYFYRLAATDSCGSRDTVSNLGRNILLEVKPKGNLSNQLRWNPYRQWGGDVGGYRIYRSVNTNYDFQMIATVSGSDTTYLDLVDDFPQANGQFCYTVEAFEVNNPLNYTDELGRPFISGSNIACVVQEARVFLPSAFYPESEMLINKTFGPSQVFAQPGTYRFYVMNRWGDMVFETNDFSKQWDGTHNGEPAPTGVYVYYLKYNSMDGLPVEQRGTLTLVR